MRILHVVSFDIPYPPDYGGVYAVYHLLKSLQTNGVHVILHVFKYNKRKVTPELQDLCFRVYSYQRKTGIKSQLSRIPYIVKSRKNIELLENLSADHYPVLFEGIHTTFYLPELVKLKKDIYLRVHNQESAYYNQLSLYEAKLKDKLYFKLESLKLKSYEPRITRLAKLVFCFTQKDAKTFKAFGAKTLVLNPYMNELKPAIIPGAGDYLVIHCNLSINDNVQSIIKILKNIAEQSPLKIIIAGKNPTLELIQACNNYKNVEVIANPKEKELETLMQNAQMHLCYSEIAEGFKMRIEKILKLGRFILCNDNFCEDENLRSVMIVENDLKKWKGIINQYVTEDFTTEMVEKRKSVLNNMSNSTNVKEMIDIIYERKPV